MILSTAYFPPVSWFAAISEGFVLSPDKVEPSEVYLEASETYQKQSWRNRCRYYSSLGVDSLSVPIVHENGTYEHPIKEIKIDYSTPWLTRTFRALDSSYRNSAYFDFYRDELFSIMENRPERLWDLNLDIISFFLKKTGVAVRFSFTEEYYPPDKLPKEFGLDLRRAIHPKVEDDTLSRLGLEKPYFQVFACKYGFKPNLSIMDLLFNEGPDSILYLKKY